MHQVLCEVGENYHISCVHAYGEDAVKKSIVSEWHKRLQGVEKTLKMAKEMAGQIHQVVRNMKRAQLLVCSNRQLNIQ